MFYNESAYVSNFGIGEMPYIRMFDEMASAQEAYLPRFINSD